MHKVAIVFEYGQWQVWVNGSQVGVVSNLEAAIQMASNVTGRRIVIELTVA